ncbi:hypothetical protein B0A52_04727 [Exophiala mesophila]|uniref:Uncharacterized protein n=1 Tax=Exophiala mesophila TaxID=212818 RepID=A0A438N951_EXOME|nr:hypothetical protein B0A52_04727 [Exophiala mesophila]
MSLWASYKGIPPKTRAVIGVAIMLNAGAMLMFSDHIEDALGFKSDKQEQEQAFKVTTVDRQTKT